MLITTEQHRQLVLMCGDHPVALCEACAQAHRLQEMAIDPFTRRPFLCPLCAGDLSEGVVEHIRTCPVFGGHP
jgi:hypothetical protein